VNRAALKLAENVAEHYDREELAALVSITALINSFGAMLAEVLRAPSRRVRGMGNNLDAIRVFDQRDDVPLGL
jgi:hypothetical protein